MEVIMKQSINQAMKFSLIGLINTLNSWLIYYILIFLNINYLISTTIAYLISSIIGYSLNKNWSFKNNNENHTKVIKKYYITYISSYCLNICIMYLLVNIFKCSNLIAPLLVLLITVPYNFILSKYWVFKKKQIDFEKLKSIHTFAICAYKESPYLEECIISVLNQEIKTNYLIATSTPNEHIKTLAKKYHIDYYVRDGKTDIQDDWNFAYNKANTELVTITHQDDIYDKNYTKEIFLHYKKNILMYNTDYNPYKNEKVVPDINCKIKHVMKYLLRYNLFSKIKVLRVISLSFGNSINCPSVTYNKKLLGNSIFNSEFKFCLDWDTFLKISKQNGPIIYIPKKLINFRIHDESTTKQFLINKKREIEDFTMFNKIWPEKISKQLMKLYVKCYKIYESSDKNG